MPSRRNALKQVRKDVSLKSRNAYNKATLKTARKDFDKIIAEAKSEKLDENCKKMISVIDKSVKKGIIPVGKGARLKSKYTLKTNALLKSKTA